MEIDVVIQESVDVLYEAFGHPGLEEEWAKIEKKLEEARYNPGTPQPLADCMLALLLAAKSRGFSVKTVFQELAKVAEDTKNRHWKKMPDGTYQAT